LNLLKRLLRKLFKSNPFEGQLERLKDGISSDAIEGEQSHLEATVILSPSMPTLDIEYKPMSKPILDQYGLFYALSPKPPDDSRNPSRYPMHRNHQDHMEDRGEQHPWLESIKNLCAIAIEWMNKALDKINSINDPKKYLDIHVESLLEVENDGDFNEQGSYFIIISSDPCSYEKSPDSLSLSNIAPHEIFNPLMLPIPKIFERVVANTFVYHKYCRSHCCSALRLVLDGKLLHQTTS